MLDGHDKPAIQASPLLLEAAALNVADVYERLGTCAEGLSSERAATSLAAHGPNVLARDQRPSLLRLLRRSAINPLVILLAVLATVSFFTADPRAGTVMVLMIVLSVGLRFYQEAKADSAAAKLKAMISVNATALRDGTPREIPLAELVPGDVVKLAAGDMIPGDVRIVQAKDLFVTQGSLTRASRPVLGMGLLIMAIGVGLSFCGVGRYLGFTALPRLYWPLLALTLACYLALTQGVKVLLLRRRWI